MKLNLNRYQIRWFILAIITIVGFVTAYIDQNIIPLLILLFAGIFLTATLAKDVQPTQRIFLRRISFATLLVMVSIGGFNYIVNPFGLYPTHIFEPIVLTTRDYKMNLYTAYSPPPQAIIIGSSRSFTVDPAQIERLWHYSSFNASVTVGSLQEYLAFLRYISEMGKLPELLILNLAPEAFRWSDNNRYSIEPDARLWNYVDYKDPLFSLKDHFYRLTRLLSKEQTLASLRVLQVTGAGQSVLAGYVTDPNGIMVHVDEPPLSPDDLNPDKVFDSYETYFDSMFTANRLDLYRFDVLQQILELAKQNHMVVIGYMPPYHPVFRDVMETRTQFTPTLSYITSQLDKLEQAYPFHYMNFIDSEAFSNDEMFYDLIHPKANVSALMMQQLYDQFHSYSKPS